MNDRNGVTLHEIEIGIVVPAVIYAPVWLADQRGFLRDEGLTVRLRSFGSTDGTTAALRDGIVPITIGSPEGSIANALGGGDLRLVSGFVNRPPLSMIAQPRYHSMADLRGAKLGTTSLKEGTCHLMEKMIPDFLFCAVCTRMNWANENRDHLIGLLRALRRGVEALYDDPVGAAEVVLGEINMKPEHARRACQESVSKTVLPRDLSIDPQAFAATLEAIRRSELIKDQPQSEMQASIDMRFLSAGEP
jgi:ABC-type nitrate/sulfonate/bicarbonate transport system substrate-binding protein